MPSQIDYEKIRPGTIWITPGDQQVLAESLYPLKVIVVTSTLVKGAIPLVSKLGRESLEYCYPISGERERIECSKDVADAFVIAHDQNQR